MNLALVHVSITYYLDVEMTQYFNCMIRDLYGKRNILGILQIGVDVKNTKLPFNVFVFCQDCEKYTMCQNYFNCNEGGTCG